MNHEMQGIAPNSDGPWQVICSCGWRSQVLTWAASVALLKSKEHPK